MPNYNLALDIETTQTYNAVYTDEKSGFLDDPNISGSTQYPDLAAANSFLAQIRAGNNSIPDGYEISILNEPCGRAVTLASPLSNSHIRQCFRGSLSWTVGLDTSVVHALTVVPTTQGVDGDAAVVNGNAVYLRGVVNGGGNANTWRFFGFAERPQFPNLTATQAAALTGLQDGDLVYIQGVEHRFDPTTTQTGDGFIPVTSGGALVRVALDQIHLYDFSGNTFTQRLQAALSGGYWGAELIIPVASRAADTTHTLDANLTFTQMYSCIKGEDGGFGGVRINYLPPNASGENVALQWDYSGAVGTPTFYASMKNLTISSTDTTRQKVLVDIVDHGEFTMSRVFLGAATSTGNTSIALRTAGREQLTFDKCVFRADRPVLMNSNPSYTVGNPPAGFLSVDTVGFNGCQFRVTPSFAGTNLEVSGDAQIVGLDVQNCNFIGGIRGFKYVTPATLAQKSHNLRFSNIRLEQIVTGAGQPYFAEINAFAAGEIHKVNFSNIDVEINGGGFLLRNLDGVVLNQCGVRSSLQPYATLDNCDGVTITSPTSTLKDNAITLLNGTIEAFTVESTANNTSTPPHVATYVRRLNESSTFNRGIKIFGMRRFGFNRALNAGSGMSVPITHNLDYRAVIVTCHVMPADESYHAFGVYGISRANVGNAGVQTFISSPQIFTDVTPANPFFHIRCTTGGTQRMQTINILNNSAQVLNIALEFKYVP